MRKINEEELEDIIRKVIDEEAQLHETTDEGVWGGIKGAATQVGSDLKNAWQNMKQAYKYGSQAQNIKKKFPAKQSTQTNATAQTNQNGGKLGNANSQPQENQKGNSNQPTNPQTQQEKKQGNRQADRLINPMRVSQGNRMIKQTVRQLITNYGLNYKQVYNALINAAEDLEKKRNEYFPQTNESRLSDETMDRLTEEIVTRIKKG